MPTVLSREEVSRLINAAGTLFRRTLVEKTKRATQLFAAPCSPNGERISLRGRLDAKKLRPEELFFPWSLAFAAVSRIA